MNIKQSILTAMAGASLFAVSQAMAQITYHNEDLLLNFRNAVNTGDVDVTVDLGPVSTFLTLTGTTVLNNGANNGYSPVFTENELVTAFGSLNNVAFTAVAVDAASDTIWVSRAGKFQPFGDFGPAQGDANTICGVVGVIGQGIGGGIGTTVTSLDASGKIVSVASGQALSYQSLATPFSQPSLIDFQGEDVSIYDGGSLENISQSGSTVYAALYKEPPSTYGTSGTYLGYFTFNGSTGEVDYTSGVPTPSPSISQTGASVVVSWAATGYPLTLLQNTDVTMPGGWTPSSYPVSAITTHSNAITITSPTGNLYFILANP
ncbi:MAG: hypothetical protein ABSA83_15625 [Verrucomicrobiota bacterium]